MASGVTVHDDVKKLISDMQVNRQGEAPEDRIRIAVLVIENGMIVVEKVFKEKDLCGIDAYKILQSDCMKDKECKYIVYDCHYTAREGYKEELVFIMWSDDGSPIKVKMNYASSKANLKPLCKAKHEFEFHCREDVSVPNFACAMARMAKSDLEILEGMDLRPCAKGQMQQKM